MNETLARARGILRQPGFSGLLGAAIALGVAHSFVSPFLSLWGLTEIGLSERQFGLYMTATSLCAVIVGTSVARWSDTHVPRKIVLLIGAAGGALGYTAYAFLHHPRWLLLAGCTLLALGSMCFSQLFAHVRERFTAGAPEPAGTPGAASTATETLPVPPGFLTSVVRVCFSVAWTAGPSIGAWMMVAYGFRGLFLGAATLFVVFLLGVLRFVPFTPHAPRVRAIVRAPVWRVLLRGDIFALFVAFALIFAAHMLNALNLPLHLTRDLGGTKGDIGITFGVGPLAEVPLMLWFGLLAARGHTLGLIRLGAVTTVIYFLLLTLARAPWHIFPLQILHGLSFAIFSNVAILFFQDLLPGQAGLGTTIFTNAANIGNLIGYLSFSAWAQPLGSMGLFFVSAALTAVTCGIVLFYRPRANAAQSAPA